MNFLKSIWESTKIRGYHIVPPSAIKIEQNKSTMVNFIIFYIKLRPRYCSSKSFIFRCGQEQIPCSGLGYSRYPAFSFFFSALSFFFSFMDFSGFFLTAFLASFPFDMCISLILRESVQWTALFGYIYPSVYHKNKNLSVGIPDTPTSLWKTRHFNSYIHFYKNQNVLFSTSRRGSMRRHQRVSKP